MKGDREMTKNLNLIYPIVIIGDRYGGTYSKAAFIALNCEYWDVPQEIDGSDTECMEFWANAGEYTIKSDTGTDIAYGKGSTPDEAAYNLYDNPKCKRFDEDTL